MRQRKNERGSIMLEATLAVLILSLFFVGLFRLGATAIRRLQVQAAVDNGAWSRAFRAPPQSKTPALKSEWLGWRARDEATGVESLRIDGADRL